MMMVLGPQIRSIENFVKIRQSGALELVIHPRSRSWLVKVNLKAQIKVKVKVRVKFNDEVKAKVMVLVLDSQVRLFEKFV